jgi:hypothetical protein
MPRTNNTPQVCDWCESPFRPGSPTELVTLNERPFVVHDYCAAAIVGIFMTRRSPIDIIDVEESSASVYA